MGNTTVPSEWGSISPAQIGELFAQIGSGRITKKDLQAFLDGKLQDPATIITLDNWIDVYCKKESEAHLAFFGQEFDLSCFRKILGQYGLECIQAWQKMKLEVHFLPGVTMDKDTNFPGWKVKPENWYYQHSASGNILYRVSDSQLVVEKQPYHLGGIVILVDTRLKPTYRDGKQMFAHDKNLLGGILADLRAQSKIAKYDHGPQSSRFGISAEEIDNYVIFAYAKKVGLQPSQIRLERGIEGNIIPQLYPDIPRKKDGQTNTWVWYEEFFGGASGRLYGGYSGYDGLALVSVGSSGNHWSSGSFRLLGVLE